MDLFTTAFDKFADALKDVLPTSPFADYIESFSTLPFLNWLNWFIPVGEILSIMSFWLAAVTLYYLYSIVLRWIKAIS